MKLTLLVPQLLVVLFAFAISNGVFGRSIINADLEATFVDIGNEPTRVHSVFKRSALVEEIMGPLSRNVRQVPESVRSRWVYHKMKVLLSILRIFLRGSPNVEILQFINWDKTIQIDQVFFVKPKNIWQVRRVIMAARALGLRVRATGAGHSRSPMYVDEGNIMMDVRDLQRHDGPAIQLNGPTRTRPYSTITAVTGVYMLELNEFMTENGVTIMQEALNDQETIGGVVSVGTHGSTYNATTYSGIVVEMRVMDALGRLRRFTTERNPELMRALSCHLGMLGIMYDLTIRVEPTQVVRLENHFAKVKDVMLSQDGLKSQVEDNFFNEISWYPFNNLTPQEIDEYVQNGTVPDSWTAAEDYVWIRTMNPVSEEEAANKTIEGPIYLPTNGSLSGGSRPGLLRASASLELARTLPTATYHYLHNVFPFLKPPKHGSETSAAFILNIDTEFDRPHRAITYLVEKTERQIKANGTTPMNALLPRFFKNSDCFLCFGNENIKMANDSGHSFVIDFLAPPSQEGFYQSAADFVQEFQGEKLRPHWAKRHDNIDGIIPHIQAVYQNLLTDFVSQKARADIDRCDMFMNSYLISIFGRSGACF